MTSPVPAPPALGLPELTEPSLGMVRARLIARWLSAPASGQGALPRVAATGKTAAGKSTLGNLLLGAADVLRSTGHTDCTDAVHRLQFPRGLVYIDLPGVASDDLLENYNRVALGLPERLDLARPGMMRVIDYADHQQAGEHAYPATDLPAGTVDPDVIVYLIAPHQQVTREEEAYLRDLVRLHGGKVLVVLNLHHGRDGQRLATDAQVADAHARVTHCYQAAGRALDGRDVVEVDCKSGTGLPELLAAMRQPLGQDRAAPLIDVISYQAEHAPTAFRDAVHEAVVSYASALATVTPASDADGAATAAIAGDVLAGYAARLAGDEGAGRREARALRDHAEHVVAELRIECAEPAFRTETRPVYRKEPVYAERTETDYSKPITRSVSVNRRRDPENLDEVITSLSNWWNGKRFGVYRDSYETETIGYETRRVSEVTGYRDVLDHTESYQVPDGTRQVLAGYQPFGEKGTALGLTAWYLALRHAAGITTGDAAAVYRQVLSSMQAGGPPGVGWLPADADQLLGRIITAGTGR